MPNEGAGTISVIDTATDKVVGTLRGGRKPRGLALAHDGKRLFVSDQTSNALHVVDLADQERSGRGSTRRFAGGDLPFARGAPAVGGDWGERRRLLIDPKGRHAPCSRSVSASALPRPPRAGPRLSSVEPAIVDGARQRVFRLGINKARGASMTAVHDERVAGRGPRGSTEIWVLRN